MFRKLIVFLVLGGAAAALYFFSSGAVSVNLPFGAFSVSGGVLSVISFVMGLLLGLVVALS